MFLFYPLSPIIHIQPPPPLPHHTNICKLSQLGGAMPFVVSRCAFCKLQRNFGFFCSVNHLSGPLRKHMFTCDWCISIHFVCFCVSRFVACDRPVSAIIDYFSWKIFLIILILVSCPRQKVHSSSRFPSLYLSSLESFSVLFLQAKLGECFALWLALTPPLLKWLMEQKNPFEVCKSAARYNEFGYKTYHFQIWKFNLFYGALFSNVVGFSLIT